MTVTMDDRHTLAGAYALDALDEGERRLFEAHLETCDECRAEVAELTATAAYLGVASAVPPPPALRHQVLAEIARTRQLPPQRGTGRGRRGVPRWTVNVLAVAATVLAVLAISLGVLAWQSMQRADDLAAEADRLAAEAQRLTAVLAAPDARNAAADVEGGGQASVVASETRGEVVLITDDLPELSPDQTYQLWLIAPDEITSAGVVDVPDSGDVTYLTAGDLGGVTTIALSVEPLGGSEQPTTTPVWAAELGSG
jgi:anti-sigma-K factor RskA